MGVGIRRLGVLAICAALHLSATAAPAQISCDGGLTQTDNGTTDLYLCTGNMTVSNGSLVVTDSLSLTAQGNLALVDAAIQASSIELSATKTISIDAGSTLNTTPGVSGGMLAISAGSYGVILGSYMGAAIPPLGTDNDPRAAAGRILIGGNQSVVTSPHDLTIAVPEPSTAALILLALPFMALAMRRRQG